MVLAVGQEKLGMKDERVIKALGMFGGGVSHSGYTCGALVGAVATLSSVYSRGNLDEKESPRMWEEGRKLVKRFEELTAPYGSIHCRDISRVDWDDPQSVKEFKSNPEGRFAICRGVVGDIAKVVGEMLEQREQGAS